MRDVDALVERIVAAARVPSRAARADLRRELRAHFEDAAAAGATDADAIHGFGAEREIVAALRRVHAAEYRLIYAAKIAAAILVAGAAAFAIEISSSLRLPPRGLFFALALVVTIAAAWELARPPLTAVRRALSRTPLLVMFVTFAGVQYGSHAAIGVVLPATRTIAAGAVLTAVSIATLVILARFDRALNRFLEVE